MLCSFNRLYYPKTIAEVEAGAYCVAQYNVHEPMVDAAGNTITEVKVVGHYLPTALDVRINISGHWSRSPKYGLQFEMETYSAVVPQTREGVVKYLSSGLIKGVGAKIAEKIYDTFGDDTLEILDSEPERLLTVPGIRDTKLEQILSSYMINRGARDVVLLLAPHGVTARRAVKIYKEFGPDAVMIIKTRPYQLCDMHSIGFYTADAIAKSMGLDPFASERIDAGLIQTLKEAETKGHLCLHKTDFINQCVQLLDTPGLDGRQVAERALLMTKNGDLVLYQGAHVFRAITSQAEQVIAQSVLELLSMNRVSYSLSLDTEITREERKLRLSLAFEQRDAIKTALTSNIAVISGGPGTGKTLIQKVLLAVYNRAFPDAKIICCAPTGRAARRMEECTGHPASTIHKALGLMYSEDIELGGTPSLDADLVLVDEVSMLDIHLAAELFGALNHGAQVILVGDADQLPSVGPGAVLSELIACGEVPVVKLDKVFRQEAGSRIAINAKLIRNGTLNLEYGFDFCFVESSDYEKSANSIEQIYLAEVAHHGIDNVALLSPFRKKTATGVNELNERLRNKLNPAAADKPEASMGDRIFRLGDKVMQTSNRGDISNGDMGYITQIDCQSDSTTVHVDYGDGRLAEYDRAELDILDLAYACTIHKSQGSEYASVIVNIQNGHYIMLKRPLLYTAITRAKERVVIIGDRKAMMTAIRTVDAERRGTMLAHRIKSHRAVA